MKKTIWTFGLISGGLCSLMMAATMPFEEKIGFDRAEYVGYTILVLSFLLVFFGVRSYRDNTADGEISFVRAFGVGICITLIACCCYVLTWEILYYAFMPDFIDKYAAYMIQKAKASGASPAALQMQMQQVEKYRALYANPLFNAGITFLEPFPVGLAITLLSAVVLRRRPRTRPGGLPLRATE